MAKFGKCAGGGRRSAARKSAPLTIVYTTVTQSHSAILVDLSDTGVRIRGNELPGMGEEVLVSVEHIRAFGNVVWVRCGQCGIAFDMPLDKGDVEMVRRKVVQSSGFTPEVKGALDDWTLGLAR